MEPKFTGGRHRRDDDQDLQASDAYLTSLSEGIDPSEGEDALASLILSLREEVEAPMPSAPLIDDTPTTVTSLDAHRARKASAASRRFRTSPWMAGLVGAAAATVLVAGTGAALYNATPGSALWEPSQAIFGDREDVVELATALDEIETRTETGDLAGAKLVIDQLRESMKIDRSERPAAQEPVPARPQETVTVQPEQHPEGEPTDKLETVTVTPEPATVTVVVTETVSPNNPTSSSVTSTTIPSTTSVLLPTPTQSRPMPNTTQPEQSS